MARAMSASKSAEVRTAATSSAVTVTPQRAGSSLNGSPDRTSTQTQCNPVP